MTADGHCHEAAARHYELAAQHHRAAAERAAGGDLVAAARLAHAANVHAVHGHRYAMRAGLPRVVEPEETIDDD